MEYDYGMDERTDSQKREIVRKWLQKDRKSCNVRFEMKSGRIVRCDSFILYKYSKKYKSEGVPNMRIIILEDFDGQYVEDVIAWMYSGTVKVTPENAWNLIKTAGHFQAEELVRYLIKVVYDINFISVVLNTASKEIIEQKPQNAFRGWFTYYQPKTFSREYKTVLKVFYDLEPCLGINTLRQLNIFSIYALMSDVTDLKTKVRLIFLTIDWIVSTRPSLQSIYGIIGSLKIDIDFQLIYSIRWHMYMFTTKYYLSSTEFYIYMDGSSEFVLPSPIDMKTNPPGEMFYPVDKNIQFSPFIPRMPNTVNLHREINNLGHPRERYRICGLYEPRGENGSGEYSYGNESTHPLLGGYLISRLLNETIDLTEKIGHAQKCRNAKFGLQSLQSQSSSSLSGTSVNGSGSSRSVKLEHKGKLEVEKIEKQSFTSYRTSSSTSLQPSRNLSNSGPRRLINEVHFRPRTSSSSSQQQNSKGPNIVYSDYLYE